VVAPLSGFLVFRAFFWFLDISEVKTNAVSPRAGSDSPPRNSPHDDKCSDQHQGPLRHGPPPPGSGGPGFLCGHQAVFNSKGLPFHQAPPRLRDSLDQFVFFFTWLFYKGWAVWASCQEEENFLLCFWTKPPSLTSPLQSQL